MCAPVCFACRIRLFIRAGLGLPVLNEKTARFVKTFGYDRAESAVFHAVFGLQK
jgi:hypothetical protein